MSSIEVLNPNVRRGRFLAVLFDFDGTLSLIREGWSGVMIGMMVEILRGKDLARESDEELWALVERFVMNLNGHPTIVQMARFADEIRARGGIAEEPAHYLQAFLDRLMTVVRGRWEGLESGRTRIENWVVPHAHAILRNLQQRGIPAAVASGTDLAHVVYEANLLSLSPYIEAGIHGPRDNDPSFSKADVISQLLAEFAIPPEELLGFGDGVVETQAVKQAGGVAIGVASAEPGQPGINPAKRTRLAAAGADIIIADYGEQQSLLEWLFSEQSKQIK